MFGIIKKMIIVKKLFIVKMCILSKEKCEIQPTHKKFL